MTNIAVGLMMPRSTSAVSRRQARRFWGGMGAAMRETSRWLDGRDNARSDVSIHRAAVRFAASDIRTFRGL
jgi:hypothetical protein